MSNLSTHTLFIYHDCTQVVQVYPKYTKKITLPKSIDLSSLLIVDDRGTIIPFRYKSPRPNPISKDTLTVTKGSLTHTGKFVSMTDTSVTLYLNDMRITIRNYDTLTLHDTKEMWDPYVKIHQQELPVTVTYLFSEITWKAIGTGIITNSNINIRLTSQITNTTDDHMIANIYCIAGSISTARHPPMPHMMRALAVEPPLISKIEDYTMYNLGEQKLRPTTIVELGTYNYPVVKFYEHYTNQPEIRLGYRFKTSQFIPEMSVYMYTNNHNYLGSTEITEYQSGEEVDLLLTRSSMVRCETTIQVQEIDKTTKVEAMVMKIINNNKDDIFLVVKHDLRNKKLIQTTCPVAKHRGPYLEWYFLIHPNTTESAEYFRCNITSSI